MRPGKWVYLTVNKIDKDNRGSCRLVLILLVKIRNEIHAELSVIAHESQTTGFLLHASSLVLLCYST